MLLAALLSAGLAAGAEGLSLADLTAEADRLVLSGRAMPRAFLLDVARLPTAAERMEALIYLRRAGLLTGPAVDLNRYVFRPATDGADHED